MNPIVVGLGIWLVLVLLFVYAWSKMGHRDPSYEAINREFLKSFMPERAALIRRNFSEEQMPPLDKLMQFQDGPHVAWYSRICDEATRIETLDVEYGGRISFLVRFKDEVPDFINYFGFGPVRAPEFPPEIRSVLIELLRRIRSYADEQPA